MPIRMIYEPTSTEKGIEVDVYHFHQLDESLDCFVTAWVIEKEYWITVPINTLRPPKLTFRKELFE